MTFEQTFRPFLQELAGFKDTTELERSGLYRKLKPGIDRVLANVWHEDFAPPDSTAGPSIRAVAWNIERGIHLDSIVAVLQQHPQLARADLLLLSELDWGIART